MTIPHKNVIIKLSVKSQNNVQKSTMQNISLNKKLVISANKTAEIQEKRFFIKMLEKNGNVY